MDKKAVNEKWTRSGSSATAGVAEAAARRNPQRQKALHVTLCNSRQRGGCKTRRSSASDGRRRPCPDGIVRGRRLMHRWNMLRE